MARSASEDASPDAGAIREQLERMLASPEFAGAPALSRFLGFVVEHLLSGSDASLKEYVLGVEVFGRGAGFDPRVDTIVRVQARRLRRRMECYYEGTGSGDAVLIAMPKGGYRVDVCSRIPPAPAPDGAGSASRNAGTCGDAGMRFRAPRLPAPRNALIGREHELGELAAMVCDPTDRLVSMTGAGGSGKTRLALQLGWELRERFEQGVHFVDLSTVPSPQTLVMALARSLNIAQGSGRPLAEAICQQLNHTVEAPLLLILDNFEHLLDGAGLVGALLDACPHLHVLVTSRIRLNVYGEREFPLRPLTLPDTDAAQDLEALAGIPAIRLFVERATASNPRFALDHGNAPMVVELCRRLDGLPLAIELMAAQSRTLSIPQMLARFADGLDAGVVPGGQALARHRTLRDTLDWSYGLLGEDGRRLLATLSVFSGGFTLEAASAVAGSRPDLGVDPDAGVYALLDHSLVYRLAGDGEPRFGMLETIRGFGLERLAEDPHGQRVRRAHAAYCLVLAEEGVERLGPADYELWLRRCDQEHSNFREAIDWLIGNEGNEWALRMGCALFRYWERREYLLEGRQCLESILSVVPEAFSPLLRAKVWSYAIVMAACQGEHEAAYRDYGRLHDLYVLLEDPRGVASTLTARGIAAGFSGKPELAMEHLEEALRLCRKLGDVQESAAALSNLAREQLAANRLAEARASLEEARRLFAISGSGPVSEAWTLNRLGDVAAAQGLCEQADEWYGEAEAGFRDADDDWGVARTLADRGQLDLQTGETGRAARRFEQALERFLELDHRRGVAIMLEHLARLAMKLDDIAQALRLVGAAHAIRETTGMKARPSEQARLRREIEPAMSRLESATALSHRRAGEALGYRDAIREARRFAARASKRVNGN